MRLEFNPISGFFDFVGAANAAAASAPKLVATFTTDVGTAVGDFLFVNGINTVTAATDNASTTIPNGVFGVGFNKPSATSIDVLFTGIVGGYAGLTVGGAVFISTIGTTVQSPPSSGTIQQIGFAVSTTEIFVNLQQAIRRA